jgi:hypothetical protein
MERHASGIVDAELFQWLVTQHFDQVPGQRADRFRLVGVGRVTF